MQGLNADAGVQDRILKYHKRFSRTCARWVPQILIIAGNKTNENFSINTYQQLPQKGNLKIGAGWKDILHPYNNSRMFSMNWLGCAPPLRGGLHRWDCLRGFLPSWAALSKDPQWPITGGIPRHKINFGNVGTVVVCFNFRGQAW